MDLKTNTTYSAQRAAYCNLRSSREGTLHVPFLGPTSTLCGVSKSFHSQSALSTGPRGPHAERFLLLGYVVCVSARGPRYGFLSRNPLSGLYHRRSSFGRPHLRLRRPFFRFSARRPKIPTPNGVILFGRVRETASRWTQQRQSVVLRILRNRVASFFPSSFFLLFIFFFSLLPSFSSLQPPPWQSKLQYPDIPVT